MLLERHVLKESVDAFVHPHPLAFVIVDDHGEVVVTDLMDNHAYHALEGTLRVGAVLIGPPKVEADHGVLHTDRSGMHGDRFRIRIVDGELAVRLEGIDDCQG